MAAGGRARADYDYLIKLLLIGDSGMYCVARIPVCLNSFFSIFFCAAILLSVRVYGRMRSICLSSICLLDFFE